LWRKYAFCGAAPSHGTRQRRGTPSVEAPLLTLLFRLQASEALVFTLSSRQHPCASPNPTPSASHAHYVSLSLFVVGDRDCSPYPGALGKADLADRTRVARVFKCLSRLSVFSCSITAFLIPSYKTLTLLFPKTPKQHVQAGRLRDARRCRQRQLGRSSWKSRRHGHETLGQEARTECMSSAFRSTQNLTLTDRSQRNFHSISILGLTCVIMCTWMGILSYVV
jgi:hypothetical protein